MDGHPYKAHRADKVEKSRVSHIAGHKHRASGGRATHKDEKADRKLIGEMIHEHAEGKKAKHRRDRVARAKGGKVRRAEGGFTESDAAKKLREAYQEQPWYGASAQAARQGAGKDFVDSLIKKPERAHGGKVGKKHKSNVVVNVMNGHGGPQPVPVPMPPPVGAAPPMPPPGPPPGAGLGAPAPGGPPMPPPGMPPRKSGGRLTSDGHTAKPMRAKGGGVKSGPAWEEGKRLGTHVSHVPAKEPDIENMNRKRVVTFNAGGKAVSFRAAGGPVESNYKVAPATKLSGGAGGGIGRREKAAKYGHRGMKEVDGAR